MRLDREGRYVTDLPGLWDESDCEIVTTNFGHPSITVGQHTNGPSSIWIRLPDGDVDWIRCRERSLHKAVAAWVEMGIEWFQLVDDERLAVSGRREKIMNEPNKPPTAAPLHGVVHTPGPWIVSPHAKNLVATADDKIGIADVAMCGPWIAKPPQEQQDANAKLMAAAPDMLEVCWETI